MKKRVALKYLKKEWKIMQFHLQSFLKKEEQEDLHQFRIQAKRIIAFLTLLDYINHDRKLVKSFSPVKKVFKQAGELRNNYIAQKLMPDSSPSNTSFKNFRLLAKRHWKKIKKVRLVINRKIRTVKRALLQRFYQNEIRRLAFSLKWLRSDNQLHECRKRIKGLLYNYKPFHYTLDMTLNTDYLEQVEETIGQWHDQLLVAQNDDGCKKKLRSRIGRLTNNFYQRALS